MNSSTPSSPTLSGEDVCPDVLVVGGGPAGATAAHDLARQGLKVLLLDRAGRIKPCGGAIPPRLIRDFEIPDSLIVAKARAARMVSPTGRQVDIPIEGGYVGMVDRETFDEWLRERAAQAGAIRMEGRFERLERESDGSARVVCRGPNDRVRVIRPRFIVGADGARSQVALQGLGEAGQGHFVFAYHEVLKRPVPQPQGYDGQRCDVYYRGTLSPDFYGWVFPHGDTLSVGSGSADKGWSLRAAVSRLRSSAGLDRCEVLRREGAPIPLKPLKRWDNGKDLVLAGDAAGVVAPASGEGIYYAMLGGRLAAQAVVLARQQADGRLLARARRDFMREHRKVFWILGIMQRFWYVNDRRRERFVSICADRDVQQLTFESYMNKALVRARPMAHVRIFFKDLAHLLGLIRA